VRSALPAIKTEYQLAQIEVRPGHTPNSYHVHVQTAAADTPDRTLGSASNEQEIEQARALIGQRVLLTEEDIIAVVQSVDDKTRFVFCAYEHKQGRGRAQGTGRGYPVSAFLESYHTSHKLLKPHTGGSHLSRYVIEDRSTSTYVLAPDYRKRWRSLLYGTEYGDVWNAWKTRRLTSTHGSGDGLRHPEDSSKHPGQRWHYEDAWYVNVYNTAGEATLDHEPPVVSHWNSEGNNTDQDTRKKWFQKGPFTIMPRSHNSSYGSLDESSGERGAAKWEVGDEFLGPGERKTR
jgi:hypothetical protein